MSTSRATTLKKSLLCDFCGLAESDELKTGKLHQIDNIVAHYYCLLLSSGLCQSGNDDEGILGFLPNDIEKELKRGRKLRCAGCKKPGATIGCCDRLCKKAFHLPCSIQRNSLNLFFGDFRTYCNDHKPFCEPHLCVGEQTTPACCICLVNVDLFDPYITLSPPCCKNGFFHKECIQRQAITAGYFFKCPLCNNVDAFKTEMLNLGIYIPEQDAAWELEQNAFQDLYIRHSRCDAVICACPKGRKYDRDDSSWEVVLCSNCGSEGCHVGCGKISRVTLKWQCASCLEVLKKFNEKRASQVNKNDQETAVLDNSCSATKSTTYSEETIIATPNKEMHCNTMPTTPKNFETPRNSRRRRRNFTQLRFSPENAPIFKEDICTSIKKSPQSSKNYYSQAHRRTSIRKHMENRRRETLEGSQNASTSFPNVAETLRADKKEQTMEEKKADKRANLHGNIPNENYCNNEPPVFETHLRSKPCPLSKKLVTLSNKSETPSKTPGPLSKKAGPLSRKRNGDVVLQSTKVKVTNQNATTNSNLPEKVPLCSECFMTKMPDHVCKDKANPATSILNFFYPEDDSLFKEAPKPITKVKKVHSKRAKKTNNVTNGNQDIRQFLKIHRE